MVSCIARWIGKFMIFLRHKTGFLQALLVLFGLGCFTASAHAQDNLSAFVDRTDISVNEVITLTVRVGSIHGSERPSLDALNRDFDLLGTTTSNSYSNINGNVQSWNEYRISLKPKTTGTFTIPSFSINGESTRPITVTVSEAKQLNGARNNDIFLTTSINKDEVYVQEQLIYTIKLYYSLRFDQGAQLSTPQVGDAVIQQLDDDANYQEIVDGIRYDVTERRFVIFPQSSGTLEIPPIYFTATVGGRNGLSRLLNRSSPMRQIDLASESHSITVKGIPASFSGRTWLPTSKLELTEAWSDDATDLEVGDSLTRNIRIMARGLSSSLLPELDYPEVNGLKMYPDQPSRSDSANQDGVIGVREEGMAIVPSTAGSFTIPELLVPWWNTETDREETARIPSRTLTITNGQAPNQPRALPVPEPGGATIPEAAPTTVLTPNPVNIAWIISAAVFALAWLFSTYMWLRSRQLLLAQGTAAQLLPTESEDSNALPDLRKSFRAFIAACEHNNLGDIRRTVLQWGQAFYSNRNILTLDQLKAYTGNATVNALLFNLEKSLYRPASEEAEEFRSTQLLKEITALHKAGPPAGQKGSSDTLPPLYKN